MLLCLTLTACTQADDIDTTLDNIASIIAAANQGNSVHYQFSSDSDFRCRVELTEQWDDAAFHWQQRYRFDLTDIKPGSFVQSKDGRRAIIYSGFKKSIKEPAKQSTSTENRTFSDRRINNIRYRASLSDDDQQLLITEMSKAISFCEETYLFE